MVTKAPGRWRAAARGRSSRARWLSVLGAALLAVPLLAAVQGTAAAAPGGYPQAYNPETAAGFTNTFTPPTHSLAPRCPQAIAATPGSDPAEIHLNGALNTADSFVVGGKIHYVYSDNPHGAAFNFTIQTCQVAYPAAFFTASDFDRVTGVLTNPAFSKQDLVKNGTPVDGASLDGISVAQGNIYFSWTVQPTSAGTWVCNFARDIRANHGGGGNRKARPSCFQVAKEPSQTIQAEIFKCVNGTPSSTLIAAGSLAVPAAGLSGPNPLVRTDVAAGSYRVNATVPAGVQLVACGRGGVTISANGRAANQAVTVPPGGAGDGKFYAVQISQTIQAEIFKCENGAPTQQLAAGGTLAVPAARLSSANPLSATAVAAGSYAVTATAPAGQRFVACGQGGVTIGANGTDASQSVTVPVGGTGDGKFYAALSPSTGFVEICQSGANGVTGTFQFTLNGATHSVPAGACSPAIQVPCGTQVVHQNPIPGYPLVDASTQPANRLLTVDLAGRNATVAVVCGGIASQTVVTFVNKPVTGSVKVCQVAGPGVAVGTMFTFRNSANTQSVQVPAGPEPGGFCAPFNGAFAGGTDLVVTQAAVPGTQVTAIAVAPTARQIGAPNLTARTVTVRIGAGITDITYTNSGS